MDLRGEWPGDLGVHPFSFAFRHVERGGVLVGLGSAGVGLGIEVCDDLLPSLRLSLGTLGLLVEAGKFVGAELPAG